MISRDQDSFRQYLKDVSAFQVPARAEEAGHFRRLDLAELHCVAHLVTHPDISNMLSSALKKADKAKDELAVTAVRAVMASLTSKLVNAVAVAKAFVPTSRFSDVLRGWMQDAEDADFGFRDQRSANLWLREFRKRRASRNRIKSEFVALNLRLVLTVAKKYAKSAVRNGSGVITISDLVQEGNVGLMRAVEKFNPDLGNRFATYAVWWIRHHVRRSMQDGDRLVKLPVHMIDTIAKMARVEQSHAVATGESLDVAGVADRAGITLRKAQIVNDVRRIQSSYLSDVFPSGPEDRTWEDVVGDDSATNPYEDTLLNGIKEAVGSSMKKLTPRELHIVSMRYGLSGKELTLQEIADQLGLSRERIRQIEEKALRTLRHSSDLRDYVRPTG